MARVVRASEINTFTYCRRAWWYQHQGYLSENQPALDRGDDIHLRHGIKVRIFATLRWIAYGLILIAIILIAGSILINPI